MAKTKRLGAFYEFVARRYLYKKGFSIQATNIYFSGGEIDFICNEEDELVFVEVKGRKGNDDSVLEAFDRRKRKRFFKAVQEWLVRKNRQSAIWRVDFIGISEYKDILRVDHIQNISRDIGLS